MSLKENRLTPAIHLFVRDRRKKFCIRFPSFHDLFPSRQLRIQVYRLEYQHHTLKLKLRQEVRHCIFHGEIRELQPRLRLEHFHKADQVLCSTNLLTILHRC